MDFQSIPIQSHNHFILDYRAQKEKVQPFFHYHPYHQFDERVQDVKQRSYQRQSLSAMLKQINKHWGAPEDTMTQIERLEREDSVVVIGGQQAGLLTGPMYTVNKIISIIKLAREQEEKLNIPVIPVFWIAGEDHDFQEINHIFSVKKQRLYKHTVKQQQLEKRSISDMPFDHDVIIDWLNVFLNDLPETVYSKQWYEKTIQSLHASETYVDFFARVLFQLFPNQGLVLVDAHHPNMRELEKAYFTEMIIHQQAITDSVYETVQLLQQKGYHVPLEVASDDANLFFHDDTGERILLKRVNGNWVGKNDEVVLAASEIEKIAKETPSRLSNNVVTRPMMQELVFPTLAFIGGDGEINYWAALKKGFEVLGVTMPPVVPRLSFSYLTTRTNKLLQSRVLDVEKVINDGLHEVKLQWLNVQETAPVDTLFAEAKKAITETHQSLQQFTAAISPDLHTESKRNLEYLERQLDYLKARTIKKMQQKYAVPLAQFEELNEALRPFGGLQERVWNPFYFINQYGCTFLIQIIESKQIAFGTEHYAVYLK